MKPTFIALLALCLCLPLAGADKKKPGTELWEFETEGSVVSSPAIGSGACLSSRELDTIGLLILEMK